MQPLRVWSFRRVFWVALTWIVIIQVVLFWHTFTTLTPVVLAHPGTNVYSYLSKAGPPFPGAGMLVLGPPLVLVGVWWKMRRTSSAA